MNLELKTYLFFTRRFPGIKGFGRLKNLIKKFYNRKKREKVISKVFDLQMEFDPSEHVDSEILFLPQYYDCKEIEYIKEVLKKGDIFIDIGANIGFYSLVASKIVGESGKVVAYEPELLNYNKLLKNIEINCMQNIKAINIALSDKDEILRLNINTMGNRGMSTFNVIKNSTDFINVHCTTLLKSLVELGISKINFLKIDIEGYEYKVLRHFFTNASNKLFPEHILIEENPDYVHSNNDSIVKLLSSTFHYEEKMKSGINWLLRRRA